MKAQTGTLQITSVVIGVKDLERAKQFYGEGLGCPIDVDAPAFVSFKLADGSASLGLYRREALAGDAGVEPAGSGFTGMTLHYIVQSTQQVDEVLAQARSAGATVTRPAQKSQWGGYFGWFSDPDGYLWKVAAPAA